MRALKRTVVLASLCAAAAIVPIARTAAQADFYEGFDDIGGGSGQDGPQNLIDKGWTFRNQSVSRGTTVWYYGTGWNYPTFITPHDGPGYLANSASWDNGNRRISTWAILPPIPGQIAGDLFTIYIASASTPNDHFQLRYSPGGGVDTGSDWDDVGDFTEVLIDVEFPGLGGGGDAPWEQVSAELPGSGRLAIRWFNPQVNDFNSPVVGIDSLTIGPPPCNQPPTPGPNETVVWTAAGAPYEVCDTITIPTTGTVVVEPGVVVSFDQGTQLIVRGTLSIEATDADHARFIYPTVYPPMIEVSGGEMDARFGEFEGQLRVESGANVRLQSCEFRGNGLIWMQGLYQTVPHVVLDGCLFDNTYAVLTDALVELRGNTFINGNCSVLRGYPLIKQANTFTGGALSITREETTQALYVDGVHAGGVADGAGLSLWGGNYLLGSDILLQGNRYALRLEGGLLPGSHVPTTGNTLNVIDVGNGGFRSPGRWPDLGIPYRLTDVPTQLPGGDLTIDPGVTVEGVADAGLVIRSTRRLIAEGLPGSPILFRAVNQSQPWQGLVFSTNGTQGPRLDHCVIEGAKFGAISSDNHLYVDNCLFQDNQVGANTNSFGTILFQKTLFTANTTGVRPTSLGSPTLNGGATPNAFEGNTAAIDAPSGAQADARNAWWGHPTGPQHPQNPGGQGDAVVGDGAASVQVIPFLTERPDFNDHPPVVRLLEPGLRWASTDFLMEQGTKVIIRWEAWDDDAIVSQRILFSPDGHYPSRFELVVDGLPPDLRSYEWTVPDPGFAVTNQPQFLRVEAVDSAGQTGWDHTPLTVPSGRLVGDIEILTDLSGQTIYAGEEFPVVNWSGSVNDFPTILPFIILEADGAAIQGLNIGGVGYFFQSAPHISTDAARLAILARNNSNDIVWFFADGCFSIRHDPRLGLVPPQVELLTPGEDDSFPGGTVVPIAWSASGDEPLLSFDIQASFNGGRTWHLIARELPADARDFAWLLPPSDGIDDVRVRVIARDRRSQNSTSGADRSFAITPGDGCIADFNGDGVVDTRDFLAFLSAWAAGDPSADMNGDTVIDSLDFLIFLNLWAAGC